MSSLSFPAEKENQTCNPAYYSQHSLAPINFCILISYFSGYHPHMFCTVILPPFSYACFLDDTLPPVFLVSLCHCIIKSAYKYLFTVLHVSYFLLQFPSLYWASLHHKLLEKLLFCSHFSNLYSLLNQLVFNPQNSTECSLEKMLVSSHQSQCRLFCARIVWLLSSIQHPWPSPGRNTFLFFAWHTGYYTFMVFF